MDTPRPHEVRPCALPPSHAMHDCGGCDLSGRHPAVAEAPFPPSLSLFLSLPTSLSPSFSRSLSPLAPLLEERETERCLLMGRATERCLLISHSPLSLSLSFSLSPPLSLFLSVSTQACHAWGTGRTGRLRDSRTLFHPSLSFSLSPPFSLSFSHPWSGGWRALPRREKPRDVSRSLFLPLVSLSSLGLSLSPLSLSLSLFLSPTHRCQKGGRESYLGLEVAMKVMAMMGAYPTMATVEQSGNSDGDGDGSDGGDGGRGLRAQERGEER